MFNRFRTRLLWLALPAAVLLLPEWHSSSLRAEEENEIAFGETDSGLRYRVLREGSGPIPGGRDIVTVHYKGWLDSGREFDSSYKREKPATFHLDRVIAGWTEGLQLVGRGGSIELEIPPDLGYGEAGAGRVIPPNARLHFLVELIEVRDPDGEVRP